jgi:hypothetical protein
MQYKGVGFFLALSLLSAGLLVNCRSQPVAPPVIEEEEPLPEIQPFRLLTKRILDRAYNRAYLDPKKFQYFLSETVEMDRDLNNSTLSLNNKGELAQEDTLIHERIIFEKETMGVATDIRIDENFEYWEIDVRFDPMDTRVLTFKENHRGDGFDLVYVQVQGEKKIPYGKEEYNLFFENTPQLLIRMSEYSSDQMEITTAEGFSIDSFYSGP